MSSNENEINTDVNFAIEIIVSGFTEPAIFLIDNLNYDAKFCDFEATTTTKINENKTQQSTANDSIIAEEELFKKFFNNKNALKIIELRNKASKFYCY